MIKSALSFLIFYFYFHLLGLSQDTLILYYDTTWNQITNKTKAVFYRKAFKENRYWKVIDYYLRNNQIQMIGYYKSNKFETPVGEFYYFYENENKSSHGFYRNGKINGEWTHWYENGQKKSNGLYRDAKMEGTWYYWAPNGILQSVEQYHRNKLQHIKVYHKNGKLYYEGNYDNKERQHGEWTYYTITGRMYFKGNFKNGYREGIWIRLFPSSKMEVIYKHGNIMNYPFGGIINN